MYLAFLSKRVQRYVLFLNSKIFKREKLPVTQFLVVFYSISPIYAVN